MDRRRVFEKIQRKIKRQRERGEKIRDERKIWGERREEGRKTERERGGGGTRREGKKERFSRSRVWRNERKRGGKKRSSKLTGASGKPNATGSPLCPKNLLSFSVPIPRFEHLLSSSLSRQPRSAFSLLPFVVHLEARQMSGIRLRHLSVSPFVTFDSRQIDEREKGTKTDFLSWPCRRWPANLATRPTYYVRAYYRPSLSALAPFSFFSFPFSFFPFHLLSAIRGKHLRVLEFSINRNKPRRSRSVEAGWFPGYPVNKINRKRELLNKNWYLSWRKRERTKEVSSFFLSPPFLFSFPPPMHPPAPSSPSYATCNHILAYVYCTTT